VSELTDAPGIVAVAGAFMALVALVLAVVTGLRVRRLRSAQKFVLGGHGEADLVAHAAELQRAFEALHARVDDVSEHLAERMTVAEDRLDGAIAYRALVRYDAYGEMSGHQSTTLALLDADHNGIVLSSIAHRDTARLYCKSVHAGEGEQKLAPEEAEAVRLALAGELASVTLELDSINARRLPRSSRHR
jgi:Protein of unknown function (DUF4446)